MTTTFVEHLNEYQATVETALAEIAAARIVERIWEHDHTVWREDPTEISNRLDWLRIADELQERVAIINGLADSLSASHYTDVVVLGMGGSSLAPDMFGRIFPPAALKVSVLDSTDADAVLALQAQLDPASSCFIVATKSGGTAETLSFFKHFYNWTVAALGAENAGEHFVAITDPGSKLEALAVNHDFRHTYLNNPNIGGRYSALSFFGMVPAACAGVNVATLLERAQSAANDEFGTRLGVILGELAKVGRDKLTLVGSAELVPFHDWIEQLVAESTGKDGVGILPIVGEPLGTPEQYGADRVFVSLELAGDESATAVLETLAGAGHPVVRVTLQDIYDIGAQFLLWELATVIASQRLDIQPFDQPDVEAAKISARAAITAYEESGALPAGESAEVSADSLRTFIASAQPGDYISIQAYLQPTAETTAALQALRLALWQQTKLATTIGYGPRFLHSTGQLHKGDRGNGLFLQISAESDTDLPIPDAPGETASAMSFNVLKTAQLLGDGAALKNVSRRLIRFHLNGDSTSILSELAAQL